MFVQSRSSLRRTEVSSPSERLGQDRTTLPGLAKMNLAIRANRTAIANRATASTTTSSRSQSRYLLSNPPSTKRLAAATSHRGQRLKTHAATRTRTRLGSTLHIAPNAEGWRFVLATLILRTNQERQIRKGIGEATSWIAWSRSRSSSTDADPVCCGSSREIGRTGVRVGARVTLIAPEARLAADRPPRVTDVDTARHRHLSRMALHKDASEYSSRGLLQSVKMRHRETRPRAHTGRTLSRSIEAYFEPSQRAASAQTLAISIRSRELDAAIASNWKELEGE